MDPHPDPLFNFFKNVSLGTWEETSPEVVGTTHTEAAIEQPGPSPTTSTTAMEAEPRYQASSSSTGVFVFIHSLH